MATEWNRECAGVDAEQRYAQLVASVGGIVWEADARTFQFTYVSEQAERLLGYPTTAWLEPGFWPSHLHPDDREWAVELCRRATDERRNHDFEYRIIAADGRTVWLRDLVTVVSTGDEPVTVRGVMVDITQQKHAEEALRESESLYRLLTETSNDLICLLDLDGGPVYTSPSVSRLLGLDVDEPFVRLDKDRVHPDDLEAGRDAWRRVVAGERVVMPLRIRHADGSWRWLETSAAIVPYRGRPHVLAVCRDATERKRAEQERQAHLWFYESLDRVNRAVQSTDDLGSMLSAVLETLLSVFACDRAWLVYPCDPDAASWRVTMERTRPEYPGGLELELDMPMTPLVSNLLRLLRGSDGPVRFGPQSEHEVPPEVGIHFSVKSQIVLALYPKVGEPYAFGLHSCTRARVWTPEEDRLLREIGRRLADALTSLLTLRSLRENEVKLREAQRMARLGYWDRDYALGRMTLSDEAYRIIGVDPTSAPDDLAESERLWSEAIHVEDRDRVLRAAAEALDGGEYDVEYRLVRPDGEVRSLHSRGDVTWDAPGRPLRMFGFTQDVTELRRAERELRASEARFRTFVDHATDAFFLFDDRGTILDVNRQACESLGYAREELIGSTPERFDPTENATAGAFVFTEPGVGDVLAFDTTHRRKDGTHVPVEVRLRSFSTDGRRYAVALARDVTERRGLEDQLRQSQKMEAVGQLAGGVAHDFNNLLTVINGYAGLVVDTLGKDDPNRPHLASILEAGERAATLTRQLLAYSRRQLLQPRAVCLNGLLVELFKMLDPLIGEHVELRLEPDSDLGLAKVDPSQFEQAVINLAVNARDAMPGGGQLLVETRNAQLDESYAKRHTGVAAGRYVLVVIGDTGHGMDESTKARIFEPFFTTKEQGKGTGLGLAMVYGFVKQSGGHVEVVSEPGRGTTFKVFLPRIDAVTPSAAPLSGDLEIPRGTETVLLAEDEDSVRSLCRHVLEASGYTVLEARNGREAVSVADGHDGPIHILVTDVVMPAMSGRELADTLTTLRPALRVLYISGYTGDVAVRRGDARAEGAFLQKPFPPIALARKVREVLDAGLG